MLILIQGVIALKWAGLPRIAFGAEALAAGEADVLEVDRDPWAGGGRRVLSLWLDDRGRALDIAHAAGPFAFAAEPAVVVAPPG